MENKTILVSVISEQTIPNILLIKEFSNENIEHLFITTDAMEKEGRSIWIERAVGFEINSITRIIVDQNNTKSISVKLQSEISIKNQVDYLVNLTGGTKPMTLAIFDFFKSLNAKIIYIPIGKNVIEELYPTVSNSETNIKYRLNLKEYLQAYGLYFQSDENLLYDNAYTFNFFNQFKTKRFSFKKEQRIINSHQAESKLDRTYFSGRWFEEYIYLKIKKDFNLSDDAISLGVKISRNPSESQYDNEYDVVFVKDNSLYVIECKASMGSKNTLKDKIDEYLYKLGAITKDFGLRTNSYIFTLTNIEHNAGNKYINIEKKRKILGIKKIVDASDFMKKDFSFSNII